MFNKLFATLISVVLPLVIKNVSPDIRAMMTEQLDALEKKAKGTKNPFDDILVALLRSVLEL